MVPMPRYSRAKSPVPAPPATSCAGAAASGASIRWRRRAASKSSACAWAPTAEQVAAKLVGEVELWQFSGNAGYRVPGIPVDVDRNVWRGDEAALRAWFGLPPAAHRPP